MNAEINASVCDPEADGAKVSSLLSFNTIASSVYVLLF